MTTKNQSFCLPEPGVSLHTADTKVPRDAVIPRGVGLSTSYLKIVVREIVFILNHQEIGFMRVRFVRERAECIHLSIAIFRGQIAADSSCGLVGLGWRRAEGEFEDFNVCGLENTIEAERLENICIRQLIFIESNLFGHDNLDDIDESGKMLER